MFKILIFITLLSISSLDAFNFKDISDRIPCVGCAYVVGMTEQLSIVHNVTFEKALEKLCNSFPEGLFRDTCQNIIIEFGDAIING